MNPHRAAVFDMDGLLFDTEAVGRWAWSEALAEVGLAMGDALYAKMVGKDMAARERVLLRHFGNAFPFEAVMRRRLAIGDAREQAGGLTPKPGALALVAALADARVPLALATGTVRERALRRLRDSGIDRFDVIVTSEEVAAGKPAPDIFLEAARRLGLLPAECLAFEDSPAGVAAAAHAGMTVLMVPDLEPSEAESRTLAHTVAPDLAALLPLIQLAFGLRLPAL